MTGRGATPGLAELLARARATGQRIAAPPDALPKNAEEAYAVQAEVAELLGEAIAGWKVALTPHGPAAAPIFASDVSRSGEVAAPPAAPIIGLEVEFAVRLAPDAAPHHVAEAFLGMELIGGRLEAPEAAPFSAVLADNLGNAGCMSGPTLADIPQLAKREAICRVAVDDIVVFDGSIRHANGDPLAPLEPCLAEIGAIRAKLAPGHFITTGSLCGVIPLNHRDGSTQASKVSAASL